MQKRLAIGQGVKILVQNTGGLQEPPPGSSKYLFYLIFAFVLACTSCMIDER